MTVTMRRSFRAQRTSAAGFTFIEILITLSIIAIAFLPLMRMFSASLEQIHVNSDLTSARYLAQEGMEKVKNLALTQAQLEDVGDVWEPPLTRLPLELNGSHWRTLRRVERGTDPLRVWVEVFRVSRREGFRIPERPFAAVVTLVADLDWTVFEETP